MTTLTVGQNKQFSTISAAVAASRDGDRVAVDAGTYVNDFATINTKITIASVGGIAHLRADAAPPNGKAILVTNTDITLDGLEFSGATVPDANGAGIRYQGGHLTILNSFFHHNQNGLLAAAAPSGSITIRNTEFSHNGIGDGRTHNLYVGQVGTLTVENSSFHDAVVGHQIKSRADTTIIRDSHVFEGAGGNGSYSIDLPNGGRAVLSGNFIEQGASSGNPVIVAFGEEGDLRPNSSLQMFGNTVVNDLVSPSTRLVWNAAGAPAELSGNSVFGLKPSEYANGPVQVSDMVVLAARPSALVAAVPVPPAAPVPAEVPTPPAATPPEAATPAGHDATTVGTSAPLPDLLPAEAAAPVAATPDTTPAPVEAAAETVLATPAVETPPVSTASPAPAPNTEAAPAPVAAAESAPGGTGSLAPADAPAEVTAAAPASPTTAEAVPEANGSQASAEATAEVVATPATGEAALPGQVVAAPEQATAVPAPDVTTAPAEVTAPEGGEAAAATQPGTDGGSPPEAAPAVVVSEEAAPLDELAWEAAFNAAIAAPPLDRSDEPHLVEAGWTPQDPNWDSAYQPGEDLLVEFAASQQVEYLWDPNLGQIIRGPGDFHFG